MKPEYVFSTFLIILLLIGCRSEPGAERSRAGFLPAVDSLLQDAVDRGDIPGAVIRIQQGDSLLHFKAYGFARKCDYDFKLLDEPEPMTTGHIFDLASLTKVFGTTFGIMLLKDRGDLDLDDPIGQYLPQFDSEEKGSITIRHLLTHTSGLVQWYPLYYKASNKQQRRRVIAGMPLKWPVGEGRHYSDLGFMLLGDIIEAVSGRSLDVFLEEELYEPLNLEHTTFNPLQKNYSKFAATSQGNPFEKRMVYDDSFGYSVEVDPASWDAWRTYTLVGEVNDGNAWYANGGVAGHAGLFSTAEELQVLARLLLQRGQHGAKQYISEAVIDTFLTETKTKNGLGWALEKSTLAAEGTPEGTFGHTGFTGTNVVMIPEYDLSMILLTNRQNCGPQEDGYYFNLHPLRQKIIDVIMSNSKNSRSSAISDS